MSAKENERENGYHAKSEKLGENSAESLAKISERKAINQYRLAAAYRRLRRKITRYRRKMSEKKRKQHLAETKKKKTADSEATSGV
jgi:hypothetical protein